MSNLRPLPTSSDGAGRRVAVVASRYNGEVVDGLLAGALSALEERGVERTSIEVVRVPGAWEIPQALAALARAGSWDALIALGAVIRGETSHFEYVAGECSRGASEVALRHSVPVAFGVLTCDTVEQARARSGEGEGNKGAEAALAALEMAGVMARIGG
jgi:6,7-dimethyl-8-ribityllumazine synthase